MKPIAIQNTIDKYISEEFDVLLKNNKDDKLLQLLIKWNEEGIDIIDIDLDKLMKELGD